MGLLGRVPCDAMVIMIDERVLFYLFLTIFSLWFVGNIMEVNLFQVLFDNFLHAMEEVGNMIKYFLSEIIDRFFSR